MTAGLDDGGVVSPKLVHDWESAYRRYGATSNRAARSRTVGKEVAAEMASASRAVAAAWRRLTSDCSLPWWVLAAVESATEAFEDQARYWESRLEGDEGKVR